MAKTRKWLLNIKIDLNYKKIKASYTLTNLS